MDTKIHERVARLEACMENVKKSIDILRDNHIVHLQERIEELSKSVNRSRFIMLAVLILSLAENLEIYNIIDIIRHLF